jgi:hypothetical protein
MKNPGERIPRFLCSDNIGRILFCGIVCHDESSFPLSPECLFRIDLKNIFQWVINNDSKTMPFWSKTTVSVITD